MNARITSIVIALLFVLTGCGQGVLSTQNNGSDVSRSDVDFNPDTDTVDVSEEPFEPPPDELGCVLVPSVGGDIFVSFDNSIEIGVYMYSLETGLIAPDETVGFRVLDDSVEAQLNAQNIRTDENGLASVNLTVGSQAGTVVVRAQTPCANSLDIEISVIDLPSGDLRVSFNYPFNEVLTVAPVEVELYSPDRLRCRDFRPGYIPTGSSRTGSAETTGDSVLFQGLSIEQEFTVVAVGRGPFGERAAQGCAEGVFTRENREVDEVISLYLIPLNPVGTYEVLSHWDFRDAIADSGPAGAIIVEVLDIFEDPGAGLVDFIISLIGDFVGGIIEAAIDLILNLTGLDDVIADAINDLIASSPFLSDIVTIGRDLRSIISELEVVSHVQIGKLGSDFEVFGVDNWIGLALYWRLDCEEDAPPDCGRIPIVLDAVDLGLLRGEWTGRVLGYNNLTIDRHPVDFNYGRLILYVLEYLVLPAIVGDPGPITLEDLMYRIFNCDGIGDLVGGGPGQCRCALGACLCDDDVEDFCEGFIDLVFGTIFRNFVNALSFDSVLDIRGECILVNNDEQLDVDALGDGTYIGTINIDGSSTNFTTDFAGDRIGD